MRVRWLGAGFVVVLVICILLLKSRLRPNVSSSAVTDAPAVVLVADLREAANADDGCALIIRAVREASKRGIHTAELSPNSNSDLLRRYRVLTVATVLLFDKSGKEIGRFEGEDTETVRAVEARLRSLSGTK
jgi:hypothetical protein